MLNLAEFLEVCMFFDKFKSTQLVNVMTFLGNFGILLNPIDEISTLCEIL